MRAAECQSSVSSVVEIADDAVSSVAVGLCGCLEMSTELFNFVGYI